MNSAQKLVAGLLAAFVLCTPLVSSAQDEPRQVLFTNVNIFDGKNEELITGGSVLVVGESFVPAADTIGVSSRC